jgi:hypothetical protein
VQRADIDFVNHYFTYVRCDQIRYSTQDVRVPSDPNELYAEAFYIKAWRKSSSNFYIAATTSTCVARAKANASAESSGEEG